VIFLLLPLIYPLGAVLRFLVLTPVALLSRRGDRLVWRYASSLFVMNEAYRREYDDTAATISRWAQELLCMAWVWLVTALLLTGRLPWSLLLKVYLVMLLWLALNQVRTLVAHRYTTDPDSPGSHVDQLLDTNTYPHGKWLPALWAPLGLRYHALHHLLPTLPYHSMRAAHDRLIAGLPRGSPYHRTVRPGLWPVLREMLRDRRRPAHLRSAVAGSSGDLKPQHGGRGE
jgi:fatty acid desaturase